MEAGLGVEVGQQLSLLSHVLVRSAVPVLPGVVQALTHHLPVVVPGLTVTTLTDLHIVILGPTRL